MEKIVVGNTHIIINDYDLGDCEALEHSFRVYDKIRHSYDTMGLYYDPESRRLYLPAGLDLWKIRKYFNQQYYSSEESITPNKIPEIKISNMPRDDTQAEALRFMIGVNEYSNNTYQHQLSVNLNTGKGKTFCSITTIAYFRYKSMIITASKTLLEQWRNEIIKYTNIPEDKIVYISGSNEVNMAISGKSKKFNEGYVYLCTHGTLRSFGDTFGWNKVTALFSVLGIGLKFFDEAHTNYDNMLMIDFFTNVYKTYYVTATPARSSWSENRIFQLSIKNVPSIDLFDENNDPHTSYVAIKWNSHPTPQQVTACKNAYGLDRIKYIDYITKQPSFYYMMRIIMDLVLKCKGKVLMYIGTNEAILRLYHWICTEYPELLGDVGIYTSLVNSDKKFNEREKRLILSTTKSAGVGEDISGLKMTIVVAEPFKSSVIARQTLGRTRDKDTMYIELVDIGFMYTKRYYTDKLATFKKYAQDISESTVSDYELNRRVENIMERRTDKKARSPFVLCDDRFDFADAMQNQAPGKNIYSNANGTIQSTNNTSAKSRIGINPYIH